MTQPYHRLHFHRPHTTFLGISNFWLKLLPWKLKLFLCWPSYGNLFWPPSMVNISVINQHNKNYNLSHVGPLWADFCPHFPLSLCSSCKNLGFHGSDVKPGHMTVRSFWIQNQKSTRLYCYNVRERAFSWYTCNDCVLDETSGRTSIALNLSHQLNPNLVILQSICTRNTHALRLCTHVCIIKLKHTTNL